ncbi:hypothetical protein ACFE04_024723 [Oxalis oulophora]
MEVLSGSGFGWPHPNLVTLYGWCLNGSEKLLVYEYMNAVDGGEECLLERARRVMGNGARGFGRGVVPVAAMLSGVMKGANEMGKLLQIGLKCSAEEAQGRPNMKEVLVMLVNICEDFDYISGSL